MRLIARCVLPQRVRSHVDRLLQGVAALETGLATQTGRVDGLRRTVDQQGSRVATLEAQAADAAGRITPLESAAATTRPAASRSSRTRWAA